MVKMTKGPADQTAAPQENPAAADVAKSKSEKVVALREHLGLWNRLKRTDPKATKPFQRSGGFRGTQIDPTWRLQQMTEQFGPVGQGWGYEQTEWTVVERMVFVCVKVWYRDPENGTVAWTGPQWGGTELVRRRRDGSEEPNDEAFKMSITDAVGKCLVQLGLAADVHMGQFDDSKYREESEAYFTAKANPDTQPAAVEAFEAQIKAKLDKVADLDALDTLWRSGTATRVREIGLVDKAAQHRITSHFAQKKAEILANERAPGPGREAA
ncbi:hypothetical protein [Aerophototrophica crusticola]|uniref:hypothetical protein n=1 Tax=Aerophototrophica crusticola TaxID=1709002 RepID=UPI000AD2C6B8